MPPPSGRRYAVRLRSLPVSLTRSSITPCSSPVRSESVSSTSVPAGYGNLPWLSIVGGFSCVRDMTPRPTCAYVSHTRELLPCKPNLHTSCTTPGRVNGGGATMGRNGNRAGKTHGMSATKIPGPGTNVAVCRKERGLSQVALARRAGVSVSLLSKIEVGDRALTQGIAAALAQAMGLTLDELLGTAPVTKTDEVSLTALNHAIRRFDIPDEPPPHPEDLPRELAELNEHRYRTELGAVLQKLPGVLTRSTNYAHATQPPDAWPRVADTYSVVYWLAARHRWMHLAELAVMKQSMAA